MPINNEAAVNSLFDAYDNLTNMMAELFDRGEDPEVGRVEYARQLVYQLSRDIDEVLLI